MELQAELKPQVYTVKQIAWDSPEGDAARRIRISVFVDEQKVPAELELDDVDAGAFHVVAYRGKDACGTGRLFAEADNPETAHIGRMAVLSADRGFGCGSAMLTELIDLARIHGFKRIVLSAQTHAMGFYVRHDFEAFGEEYLDAGIPHRLMEKIILNSEF